MKKMFVILIVLVLITVFLGLAFFFPKKKPVKIINPTRSLKQIGLALRMYAEEYDGYFPPQDGAEGLELLRKSGILENPHMYTCYDSNRYKAARNGQPLKENNVGFVYRGGLRSDSPPVTAVAWDKPFNYDKFGYILFVDGHVSGYAGANWMDNIK